MAREIETLAKAKDVLPKPSTIRMELKKQKTPYSKTFLNPNGTFTKEVSSEPINFVNKHGNWDDIDNSLKMASASGYSYENANNSYKARFAQNNNTKQLVYFETDPKHWIKHLLIRHKVKRYTV